MRLRNLTATAVFGFAAIFAANISAQNLQSVSRHGSVHDNLLASQADIQQQIRLNETKAYMDIILDEEPEFDSEIFKLGWESQSVNPYGNAIVPEKQVIDVSNYAMPHNGYITSKYGYRRRFRRMHKGIDIKCQIGDTIRAAFDGKVRLTRYERRGYGYYVVLRHENGLETIYGHLSGFLVEPNDCVKAGDPIALGGNTGRSTGSHLHFETRFMGYAINPAAIFDFENQTTHTDEYTFQKSTFENSRNYAPKGKRGHYSGGSTYRIRKGDSLGKIARKKGVTVSALCRLNGISRTTKLQIGRVLRVR